VFDDGFDLDDDVRPETGVESRCPHCGEAVTLALDSGGGSNQEYVEDCEVCCRPWRVRVRYGRSGRATVILDPL
jgi:hypothetical protein